MVVFGRSIALRSAIPKAAQFVLACYRAVQLFEDPWHLIQCYMRKQPLGRDVLKMRSGHEIAISQHVDDVVTIFVVFCKEDYGTNFEGMTILDIGANIGIFSLCAALNGAKKVVSIEPSVEAFATLQSNVENNSLNDIIAPMHYAISSADGDVIPFPIQASPYNQMGANYSGADTADVETLTLKTLLDTCFSGNVDLLKMDCEGAEFEIFAATQPVDLARIKELKMEYHKEEYVDLLQRLKRDGFEVTFHQPGRQPSTGTIWLVNNTR
ncbi:MAG: FkbM family methyltransferase [Rhizobiaceae bacterium]